MERIVHLEALIKTYGEGAVAVHALSGVDLEVDRGEFMAIAGPSGSGKSTLLNIMSGLDEASSGVVEVVGRDLQAMNRSQRSRLRLEHIGFVFQSYNLLPVLTAYENAEYVLMLQRVSAQERRSRVMRVLQQVGLEGMEHRFPRELSGGQQQRVAVARAIAAEPALILADEPTANLDQKTGADLMELMLRLNEEKSITFVFSSHDPNVLNRARRLLVLTDGKVSQDGPTGDRAYAG